MKAIGYFFIKDKGDGSPLLLGQQEAFSSYCERYGHQSVKVFLEYDFHSDTRPRYGDLLDYLKRSGAEFLVIIAGAQDLGDTLEQSVRRVLELDKLGAKIVCSDDSLPDPLQQAIRYWQGVSGSGLKGNRIKEAMKAKAIRGEGLGKPPYGYKIGIEGKLDLMSGESDTVRLIFNLYNQENMGMRRIVSRLNEIGIATRSGRGWSIVTVRDILRNRVYLGTYTRFGMRVPSNHQPIIDSSQFNTTQNKMRRSTTTRIQHPSEPYLLSGFVYCASCGNSMVGVSRRQGWRRKDGSKSIGYYRYYQCQSRTNQGMCSYHTWRSVALEQHVMAQVKEALESGEATFRDFKPDTRGADFKRNLKRLDAQFLKALESSAAGITSLEYLNSTLEYVDAQREALRGTLSLDSPILMAVARGDISNLLQSWESLGRHQVSQILGALVSKIYVDDTSVEFTFNTAE